MVVSVTLNQMQYSADLRKRDTPLIYPRGISRRYKTSHISHEASNFLSANRKLIIIKGLYLLQSKLDFRLKHTEVYL